MAERERHPGFNALVSPTHDWREPAPGKFHWVRCGKPDREGMCNVERGFTATRKAALKAAGLAGFVG